MTDKKTPHRQRAEYVVDCVSMHSGQHNASKLTEVTNKRALEGWTLHSTQVADVQTATFVFVWERPVLPSDGPYR